MRINASVFFATCLSLSCSSQTPVGPTKKLQAPIAVVDRQTAWALSQKGHAAVPDLTAAVSSPNPEAQRAALWTLARLGPDAAVAVPALAEALKDKTVDVRIRAAMALGKLGTVAKASLPALIAAAADTSPFEEVPDFRMPQTVSQAAVAAALAVDPGCGPALAKSAVPPNVAVLRGENGRAAERAAVALMPLGPHAAEAVPALKGATEKHDKSAGSPFEKALFAAGVDTAEPYLKRLQDPQTTDAERQEILAEMKECVGKSETIAAAVTIGLKSKAPLVRREAQWVLRTQRTAARRVLPTLLMLLDDAQVRKDGGDNTIWESLVLAGPSAVPGLAAAVKDERRSDESRLRAINALIEIGPASHSALPALAVAAEDINPLLAAEAACAYIAAGGEPSKVLPALEAGLKSKIGFVAVETLRTVSRTGPKLRPCVPALIALLKHPERAISNEAVTALHKIGPAAAPAVPALTELVRTARPYEAEMAAFALEHLGPDAAAAVPALAERLGKRDGSSEVFIIAALGEIGPAAAAAAPALLAYLDSKPNPDMETRTLQALGRVGPGAVAVPALTAQLNNADERCCGAAAYALGRIGPAAKDAVPVLTSLRDDSRPSVRLLVRFALAKIAGEPNLGAELIDELWHVGLGEDFQASYPQKSALAEAIALLGADARAARDQIVSYIAEGLIGSNQAEKLCLALARMTDDAAAIAPKLIPLIEKPARDNSMRLAAIECLGKMGPSAKSAEPALRRLMDGDDTALAIAAAEAIDLIVIK